jgi:hypothetical protein
MFITKRTDCVETLVVGKKEQDVGLFSLPPHHLAYTLTA